MPLQDYAILIGANKYEYHSSLNELRGAIRDTADFLEWLLSDRGGNVPVENVRWLCTPEDLEGRLPPLLKELKTKPAEMHNIEDAMRELSELNEEKDGEKVGRRLYLHFSGHGVARGREEICFLASNHTRVDDRYVEGRKRANLFVEAAVFDEVFLFMDCCRVPDDALHNLPDPHFTANPDAALNVRTMYSFASQFGQAAREKDIDQDGKFHGIFSRAVLEGLRGAAVTAERTITHHSLETYVVRRFKDLRDSDSKQEPVFTEKGDFVIATDVDPVFAEVIVELSDPAKDFQVLDGGNNLEPVDIDPEDLGGNRRKISLLPGKRYQFVIPIDGAEGQFEMSVVKTIEEGGARVTL